jgi:hypothetical protein
MPIPCHIDFSVFLADGTAYGNVAGTMELPFVPRVGENISFLFPDNGVMPLVVPEFSGIQRVNNVTYNLSELSAQVLLSLEDVTLATRAQAQDLFHFFYKGYGLCGYEYEL